MVEDAFGSLTFGLGPVRVVSPPEETNRLFVVENGGQISVIPNLEAPTKVTALNISSRVNNISGEGLLGMAFHPDFSSNGFLYTVYADDRAASGEGNGTLMILSRWTIDASNPNLIDPASEIILLSQVAEWQYHNWNDIHFGPDGYLYVAVGDEGKWDDQLRNSQKIDKDLFSGLLRIDVDRRDGNLEPNPHPSIMRDGNGDAYYAIPADNPYIGITEWQGNPVDPTTVRTEFFAVGLRNPWRFSIDSVTGDIYAGDVGQGLREEIDLVVKGGNYGWSYREGTLNGFTSLPGGTGGGGGGTDLPGNLLTNASIEEGNGNNVTGWQSTGNDTFFKSGAGAFGYNYGDSSTFPDGSAILKGYAYPGDVQIGISRFTQNLSVVGGQVYVAGAYFYHTSNPDNDAIAVAENSTRMQIEVEWIGSSGESLRIDYSPFHHGENIPEIWAQTRIVLTAPVGAVSANYSILCRRDAGDPVWVSQGGGSIFADQLYFGDGVGLSAPQLSQNLLGNDSFEQGEAPDSFENWWSQGSASTFREGTGANGYDLGSGTFPDGFYALKMWGDASDLEQTSIGVAEGEPYLLRALTYHSSTEDSIAVDATSTRLFLRVEWFSGLGLSLGSDTTESHTGLSPSDQWIEIGDVFTAPAGAATATVHFETDSDTGSGSVWADLVYFGQGFPDAVEVVDPDPVDPPDPADPTLVLTDPLLEYNHSGGSFGWDQGNSVTGGFVYRGDRFPELVGKYIFADFSSGNIWSLTHDSVAATEWTRLAVEAGIAGLDPDPRNGDVLFSDVFSGRIKRLARRTSSGGVLPATLSETGVFSDLVNLTVNPGVLPYELNVPFWSDHAKKTRWFSIPETDQQMVFSPEGNWTFPDGAVWIKHFDLEMVRGDPSSAKRIETRLLVKNTDGAYGMTYRWGNSEIDAVLVPEDGLNETFAIELADGTMVNQEWHYPSRSECISCHTPEGGHALGFTTAQMNRLIDYGDSIDVHQLEALESMGYFSNPIEKKSVLPKLARKDDADYSLEFRARSYLQANCSMCHTAGGNGGGIWDARIHTLLQDTEIMNGRLITPTSDGDNRVVVPGDTEHSMIYQRAAFRGIGQMPPISNAVDEDGVQLLYDWIESLAGYQSFEEWQIAQFGATDAEGAGEAEDPDRDLSTNYIEYLTETDPHESTDFWEGATVEVSGDEVVFHYRRLANLGFVIEVSSALGDESSWEPLDVAENLPTFSALDEMVTVTSGVSSESPLYYRIRIYR